MLKCLYIDNHKLIQFTLDTLSKNDVVSVIASQPSVFGFVAIEAANILQAIRNNEDVQLDAEMKKIILLEVSNLGRSKDDYLQLENMYFI